MTFFRPGGPMPPSASLRLHRPHGFESAEASRDKWRRVQALSRLAKFLHAYREAFAAWRKGIRNALFPPGTYLLRINHGVPCAAT